MSGADAAECTVREEGAAAVPFPPGDDDALPEETPGLAEETPGLAEACRRFPMPDDTQAERALRELSWGEHFVAGRMVPSKGGSDLYLYSLKSAAVFLLDRDQANIGKASDQIIKLIDVDAFIAWVRGTVGDEALADALAADCPAEDPYHDRLEGVQRLLALRMVQYGAAERAGGSAGGGEDAGAAPGEGSAPL